MTDKPVLPREAARQDVEAAMFFYADEGGERLAFAFSDAVQAAYGAIARRPRVGSPSYALEFDMPGLRTRPLRRFPYRVFYVEQSEYIEVWRVLHNRRDAIGAFEGRRLSHRANKTGTNHGRISRTGRFALRSRLHLVGEPGPSR